MKRFSFASLMASILFVSLTFSFSKFQSPVQNYASFGWPFIFFTAEPEKQIMAQKTFSGFYLGIDWILCLLVSYLFINIVWIERRSKHLA